MPPTPQVLAAIKLLKASGYEFNVDEVTWTNASPEHWQPLDAEILAVKVVDLDTSIPWYELDDIVRMI